MLPDPRHNLEHQARRSETVEIEEAKAHASAERKSLESALASTERQLVTLTKLRVRELLTDNDYLAQRKELETEKLKLRAKLENEPETQNWFEPEKLLKSFSNRAVSWFQAGDDRVKRLILEIAGSNPILKDGKLLIEATKPFKELHFCSNFPTLCAH